MSAFLQRSRLIAVAALIIVVCAAAIVAELYRTKRLIQSLQVGGYRTLQSRLTIFEYAPYRVLRSAKTRNGLGLAEVGAAIKLREELDKRRLPRDLDRLAHAEIALGDLQSALDLLNEAVHLKPNDATFLSDLSAVQLAMNETADGAETAGRAVEQDASLPAAAFNWALALEQLANYSAAASAWQRYLALDSRSGWAMEARDHLARLRQPTIQWDSERERLRKSHDQKTVREVVSRCPQRTRQWVQDDILEAWVSQGQHEELDIARAVAEARAASGDPFLLDVVTRLTARDDPAANAVETFASARRLLMKRDVNGAAIQLRTASDLLRRVQSPLALAAESALASTEYYRGENEAALNRLASIEPLARNYPSIAAEIDWVRGLIFYRLGRPNDSLQAYRKALSTAQRVHETEAEIALGSLISGLLDTIGDPHEADAFRTGVLRRLAEIGSPPQRTYITYSQAAYAELRAHRPRVALTFVASQSDIAAEEEKQKGDTLLLAETEALRALVWRELDRPELATSAIGKARAYASQVKTDGLRDRIASDIDYIDGNLLIKRDPRLALVSLDASLAVWDRYRWRNRAAYGHLARGETRVLLHDVRGAEDDFRTGISVMEGQRQTIDEPLLRVAYFERSDRLFSMLCELLLQEQRPLDALDVAERKRARELLDRLSTADRSMDSAGAVPLSSHEIAARLHGSTLIVEYALTDHGVAIWTISNSQVHFAFSNTPTKEIESLVGSFLSSITAGDDSAIRRDGRRLFDLLILPVKSHIDPMTRLVVVPDGILNSLPFACLVASDGRFLVEQKPIVVASSATTFVRSAFSRPNANDSILAVAAPAPSTEVAHLANAEREVEEVSRGYAHPVVMSGHGATPTEFLDRAASVDVVHFAGHAEIDMKQPGRSALLFGSFGDIGPARLDAATIAAERLQHAPLVVLAACRTGSGKTQKNEGVASLAAAFLHAGARGVVASLWDLDDNDSLHLFRTFHANLQRGASCADALQAAQLTMLRSTNAAYRRPSAWAGVALIGTI